MRVGLPEATARIAKLPIDHRGFPVPWFVQWFDKEGGTPGDAGVGVPDFRVIDSRKMQAAYDRRLCWVCGEPMGKFLTFVSGPMCAINRVSAEPPCHLDCGRFSACGCPFLTQPRMRRNEQGLPDESKKMPGLAIDRNPGCCLLWTTLSYKPFRTGTRGGSTDGVLFRFGDPTSVEWYASGRTATRDEVLASIDSGFPLLMAEAVKDGAEGVKALREARHRVEKFLPHPVAA